MEKIPKYKIELSLLLAFELGRNFEQIYLDLDLYNTINFDDLFFAKEKGMQIDKKNINLNMENYFKSKITTDIEMRKLKRLKELKNKLNEVINSFDKYERSMYEKF